MHNPCTLIRKFIKAAFWCIRQTERFTYADFVLANPEHAKIRPGRILGVMVQLDILDRDDSDRKKSAIAPVWYTSKWLVKNREQLEKKYGMLKKCLTRKSGYGNGTKHENCDDDFGVDGVDSFTEKSGWDL